MANSPPEEKKPEIMCFKDWKASKNASEKPPAPRPHRRPFATKPQFGNGTTAFFRDDFDSPQGDFQIYPGMIYNRALDLAGLMMAGCNVGNMGMHPGHIMGINLHRNTYVNPQHNMVRNKVHNSDGTNQSQHSGQKNKKPWKSDKIKPDAPKVSVTQHTKRAQAPKPVVSDVVTPRPTNHTDSKPNESNVAPVKVTAPKNDTSNGPRSNWIQRPPMPPPLEVVTPETLAEKQRMWREYRQAMKPFKNREFSNAKRIIQRLGKKKPEELDEKEQFRLLQAEQAVAAHKLKFSQRAAIRWVKSQDQRSNPADASSSQAKSSGQTPAQIYVKQRVRHPAPWNKYTSGPVYGGGSGVPQPNYNQNLQWGPGRQLGGHKPFGIYGQGNSNYLSSGILANGRFIDNNY